jgi:hypothetical protein
MANPGPLGGRADRPGWPKSKTPPSSCIPPQDVPKPIYFRPSEAEIRNAKRILRLTLERCIAPDNPAFATVYIRAMMAQGVPPAVSMWAIFDNIQTSRYFAFWIKGSGVRGFLVTEDNPPAVGRFVDCAPVVLARRAQHKVRFRSRHRENEYPAVCSYREVKTFRRREQFRSRDRGRFDETSPVCGGWLPKH